MTDKLTFKPADVSYDGEQVRGTVSGEPKFCKACGRPATKIMRKALELPPKSQAMSGVLETYWCRRHAPKKGHGVDGTSQSM